MNISSEDLERIQELDGIELHDKEIISIILNAINDWPYPADSLDEYEKVVFDMLGENVDEIILREYFTTVDFSKHAWESESLGELVEIFKYYNKGEKLRIIMRDFRKKMVLYHNQ